MRGPGGSAQATLAKRHPTEHVMRGGGGGGSTVARRGEHPGGVVLGRLVVGAEGALRENLVPAAPARRGRAA